MSTKLTAILKQEYSAYKKRLSALEKEKKAVAGKIAKLEKEYSDVLKLMEMRGKVKRSAPSKAGKGKRAARGTSTNIVLETIQNSKKPIRGVDVINLTKGKVSFSSVRQILPKLVKNGKISKNRKDKTYRGK